MIKKLITPAFLWTMFLTIDILTLIKGIQQQESWKIALAGTAFITSIVFVLMMVRHSQKELKAVKVKG